MNQTLNHCDSSLCGSGSDSTGPTVEMAGRETTAQSQLNKTQASASQTTVRYSAGTSRFAAQVMNNTRIGKNEKKRAN